MLKMTYDFFILQLRSHGKAEGLKMIFISLLFFLYSTVKGFSLKAPLNGHIPFIISVRTLSTASLRITNICRRSRE